MEESGPDEYDKVVITKNMETVDVFSSCVIPLKAEKAYIGEHINIMIQVLQTKDGSLLQSLTMQNAYTKLRRGSKNAVMVVRNSMAYPQTLKKKPQWPEQWLHSDARTASRDQVAGGGRQASRPLHT